MRLTLRTLLAYLDDVLEPVDSESLGSKIQESEFASSLIHRIRGAMRKLRLGAPKLDGRGMEVDPNTVAEYLDSTLSSDRVPDFEKACLESDVALAEVASCHQILTLVLGEPADVSPAVRQRVYRLTSLQTPGMPPKPDVEEGDAAQAPSSTVAPAVAEEAESAAAAGSVEHKVSPEKPEIPDYLKASNRRRVLPYLATALLVFLIASIGMLAIGTDTLMDLFRGDRETAQSGDSGTGSDEQDASAAGESSDSVSEDSVSQGSATVSATEATESQEPDLIGSAVDDSPSIDCDDAVDAAATQPPPATTSTVPPTEVTTDEGPDLPLTPADRSPPTDSRPALPEPLADPTLVDPVDMSADVGRFTSEKQMIARFNPESGEWYRVPTNTSLVAGDRMLVLPNYRPQLTLASGIQLTFAGPSLVELGRLDDRGFPQLTVIYGQIVFVTFGRGETEVSLNLAGRPLIATFGNAASMALAVQRYLPPGTDPINGAARHIAQLMTTSGRVLLRQGESDSVIDEGQAHILVDDQPGWTVPVTERAPWIDAAGATGVSIDQIAAQELEDLVDTERPIVVSLEERVADDLVEIRSLASRCLSFFDRHESFVNMLMNPDDKSFWDGSFDTAQQALARGPESANAMLTAFRKLRGVDGDALYRLLWGFSQEQLVAERADETLVEYLDNDSLDFRVLAFITLQRITGKTHGYHPHVAARRRIGYHREWQERADRGEIRYAAPVTLPVPPPPGAGSTDGRGPDGGAAPIEPPGSPAGGRPGGPIGGPPAGAAPPTATGRPF